MNRSALSSLKYLLPQHWHHESTWKSTKKQPMAEDPVTVQSYYPKRRNYKLQVDAKGQNA